MAGCSASASVIVPWRASSSDHPSTAPGTVTDRAPLDGMRAWPARTSASHDAARPVGPLAFSPCSRPSGSHTIANRSPPMPVIVGSTTARTAAAVTAASTALPPRRSTSRPADEASGWLVAIMPRRASDTERVPRGLPDGRSPGTVS